MNEFYVYLLECTDKSTYVGATVDLDHRLRQHNKELVGGAHATSIKVVEGHAWERVCHITGFPIGRRRSNLNGLSSFTAGNYQSVCIL